jgi:hypothetical protein
MRPFDRADPHGWADLRRDLECIGRFLARRDVDSLEPAPVGRRFDVLVLCGSAVLASLELAARAFGDDLVDRILVTGGIGHSTSHLATAVRRHPTYRDVQTAGRPEAQVFAEILERHLHVPADAMTTETASTNCGDNAELSLRMLTSWSPRPRNILLVQDPTMQRRTHAAFQHHQRESADPVSVFSHAPFLPVVTPDGVGGDGVGGDGGADFDAHAAAPEVVAPTWTLDRFTSLAIGEVRRLHDDGDGYGPRGAGFIGHVDVPADVLAAYRRVRASTAADLRQR